MTTFFAWGVPEGPSLIIILLLVLLLFGAKRLPELARSLGQSMNEFKKAKDEFSNQIDPNTPVNPAPPAATVATTNPPAPAPQASVQPQQPGPQNPA
ncbi:MAG: twin-arginine translocase TatA/TatE family subunit [Chthoniobacterales bacterium]